MWTDEPLLNAPQRPEFEALEPFGLGEATSPVLSARSTPDTPQIARGAPSPSPSSQTAQSSGGATIAIGTGAQQLTASHVRRLKDRGLDPSLCVQLGVWSTDNKTLAFDYRVRGQTHNTKLRRGKGNMPWAQAGKELVLWNLDCLAPPPEPHEAVIITEGEFDAIALIQAGYRRVVSVPNGAQTTQSGFAYLGRDALHPDLEKFGRYILATDGDGKGRECRDALAVRLGDERCRSVLYPEGSKDANDVLRNHGVDALRALIDSAKPMWTDEVCRLSDVPEPPTDEPRYRLGINGLDHHGLRITLPCFWPLVGPYGSGKSVLLRQLLVNFYKLHGWRCLLTAFEERVKPRFQRDLRRHFIDRPNLPDAPYTADEIAMADEKIDDGFVFLRRARGKDLDANRLLDRIEYAVKVYGIKCVAIDPINEVRLTPERGQSKTDYMGEIIMRLKDLAEDYGLCVIVCAHTAKEATEKKLRGGAILTLNDGEDTRHWGGKADIGWAVWRNLNGPTMLHVDKVKDHETMGKPTLCELELDKGLAQFSVVRLGYDEVSRA